MKSKPILYAVHDYQCTSKDDISFKKGDRLKLIDDSDDDWWKAYNMRTTSKGLIPKDFVAFEGALECKDYYHGKLNRKEADKLLINCQYGRGTFLVRSSDQNKTGYSLSIKTKIHNRGYAIKHYKIYQSSGRFWIAQNNYHPSLDSLIDYYRAENHRGLCCRLSYACPKQRPDLYDITPMYKKKYNIARDEIRLEKRLGQGCFGEVWYGKWREQTEIAVKTMKPGTMSKNEFLQEAEVMKKLRHRKLVALYGVCIKNDEIWIITEYMKNGSLLEFLRYNNDSRSQLPFEDLIYFASQVASGMAYLEKKKLIHRDLAARNVLVGENNIVKIADFGLARAITEEAYTISNNAKFPIKWTAPEAITYQTFTVKSDVWSFGILLYEIFTYGSVPYPGLNMNEVVSQVLSGYKMQNPLNFNIPDIVYEIMTQCWELEPSKRPTFDYLEDFFEFYGTNTEGYYGEVLT